MIIKRICTVIIIGLCCSAFAQKKSLNDYKYVIVPKQFDFVNKVDKYQTSTLSKFLFEKYGFSAFLTNEPFPDDLSRDRCLALTCAIIDNSSMFTTKHTIELKDCYNTVVFKSKVGTSKLKDYKKAYHEAIRDAFLSIKNKNYAYNGQKNTVEVPLESKTHSSVPIPNPAEIISQESAVKAEEVKNDFEILYAQRTKDGFQLVNTEPKIVYHVLETSLKNVYILKNKKGIFYQLETNLWMAEFYSNNSKTRLEYRVKF